MGSCVSGTEAVNPRKEPLELQRRLVGIDLDSEFDAAALQSAYPMGTASFSAAPPNTTLMHHHSSGGISGGLQRIPSNGSAAPTANGTHGATTRAGSGSGSGMRSGGGSGSGSTLPVARPVTASSVNQSVISSSQVTTYPIGSTVATIRGGGSSSGSSSNSSRTLKPSSTTSVATGKGQAQTPTNVIRLRHGVVQPNTNLHAPAPVLPVTASAAAAGVPNTIPAPVRSPIVYIGTDDPESVSRARNGSLPQTPSASGSTNSAYTQSWAVSTTNTPHSTLGGHRRHTLASASASTATSPGPRRKAGGAAAAATAAAEPEVSQTHSDSQSVSQSQSQSLHAMSNGVQPSSATLPNPKLPPRQSAAAAAAAASAAHDRTPPLERTRSGSASAVPAPVKRTASSRAVLSRPNNGGSPLDRSDDGDPLSAATSAGGTPTLTASNAVVVMSPVASSVETEPAPSNHHGAAAAAPTAGDEHRRHPRDGSATAAANGITSAAATSSDDAGSQSHSREESLVVSRSTPPASVSYQPNPRDSYSRSGSLRTLNPSNHNHSNTSSNNFNSNSHNTNNINAPATAAAAAAAGSSSVSVSGRKEDSSGSGGDRDRAAGPHVERTPTESPPQSRGSTPNSTLRPAAVIGTGVILNATAAAFNTPAAAADAGAAGGGGGGGGPRKRPIITPVYQSNMMPVALGGALKVYLGSDTPTDTASPYNPVSNKVSTL